MEKKEIRSFVTSWRIPLPAIWIPDSPELASAETGKQVETLGKQLDGVLIIPDTPRCHAGLATIFEESKEESNVDQYFYKSLVANIFLKFFLI